VPLDLPMWWGRVSLFVRPGDVVHVQRLYTVVEGTPDPGYRQFFGWICRCHELEDAYILVASDNN
jgi:hypothetical protein